jgi:hypothetical protein
MTSSEREVQKLAQDALVALDAQIDEVKGEIQKLEGKIEAFQVDK